MQNFSTIVCALHICDKSERIGDVPTQAEYYDNVNGSNFFQVQ